MPASNQDQASRGRLWWVRLLFAIAVLGLCALFLRRIDPARVLEALKGAHWQMVGMAMLINVVFNLPARVMRWQSLLLPLPHRGRGPRFRELLRLYLASLAANNLLPAHPGEALRVVQLNLRHGYTPGAVVASLLLEKLICWLTVALGALVLLLFFPLPRSFEIPMIVYTACVMALIITLALLARRWGATEDAAAEEGPPTEPSPGWVERLRGMVRSFLQRLAEAMHLMHTPRVWMVAVSYSFLSSLADIAMVGLCLYAVNIQLGVMSWAMFFLIVNMVIVIPSTPGQVGVLETGGMLVLGVLGVDHSQGLSATLIYHAAHLLPMTLLGLVGFQFLSLKKAD